MRRQPSGTDWQFIYRIAAEADCSHHSVEKFLRGEPVRGRAGRRILAALSAAGVTVPESRPESTR